MTPENHAQLALADMANLVHKQFALMNNATYWLQLLHIVSAGQVKSLGLADQPNLEALNSDQQSAWVMHVELTRVLEWFKTTTAGMKGGSTEEAVEPTPEPQPEPKQLH